MSEDYKHTNKSCKIYPPQKKILLLNNPLKKLHSVFTIVLGRGDACRKTGVHMNSADTEYHRSTLFCPRKSKINNDMLTPRVLLLHTDFLLPNNYSRQMQTRTFKPK